RRVGGVMPTVAGRPLRSRSRRTPSVDKALTRGPAGRRGATRLVVVSTRTNRADGWCRRRRSVLVAPNRQQSSEGLFRRPAEDNAGRTLVPNVWSTRTAHSRPAAVLGWQSLDRTQRSARSAAAADSATTPGAIPIHAPLGDRPRNRRRPGGG